jgi:membrane fusion protein (multidrug efflux system)
MKKRLIVTALALVALFAGLGLFKFLQIRTAIAQGMAWRPPPEAVTTIVARAQDWADDLEAIGTVEAVQGVMVSADLPGVVKSIEFESGERVAAGAVLARLDTEQEEAQLAAAEAQRDLARLNLDRTRRLREGDAVAQVDLDRSTAEARQAEARVGEIRATIARKQLTAPFAGVLGIRQANLGQYLNAGEAVVPLQSLDPIYVDFSVPQGDLRDLRVGAAVHVEAESVRVERSIGRVTAINSVVDESTRNVRVQSTFANPGGRLRPGMFVQVRIVLGHGSPVIAIPASAVNYAPYGNSVFVVKDLKDPAGKPYRGVEQRFVKLGGSRGDQVAIAGGLKEGEEVVTSGVFKLRSGAAVVVNNQVRPGNNPAPKPEDS